MLWRAVSVSNGGQTLFTPLLTMTHSTSQLAKANSLKNKDIENRLCHNNVWIVGISVAIGAIWKRGIYTIIASEVGTQTLD